MLISPRKDNASEECEKMSLVDTGGGIFRKLVQRIVSAAHDVFPKARHH